jgi:hypothetical protein
MWINGQLDEVELDWLLRSFSVQGFLPKENAETRIEGTNHNAWSARFAESIAKIASSIEE